MTKLLLVFAVLLLPLQASADIQFTDMAGREIRLEKPADKVILGEGRFLSIFGVLGVAKPLTRVAGMMNEFRSFDPDGFARYRAAFPEIDRIPVFGETSEETVSVEQAILAQPEVAIFGVQGHGPGARSRHIIDKLKAAGITTVFIDFRQHPLQSTARSVEIVSKVLGLEDRGRAFADFYRSEVARVTERLKANPPTHCPSVLLEVRVDLQQPCCISIASGMFADLVEAAGGCNVAKGLLPGSVGQLSLEHVIATAPQVYIGTAIGSTALPADQSPSRIILGVGGDPAISRKSLQAVLQRSGIASLPAVVNQRAHGLWHHFYNSPLNVYALQKIAQWLHPELFRDLQPEKTLNRLLFGFAPVDLQGVYAISQK
ncbi:MAG: ABC transporter substrate-binding protein [Candidatus Thiodiazotropha sp. (ex Ctena orbiculata)]|nr:ABC transporter substrate-binding protein [Candidatus Thiodiazotropha taylori]